MLKDVAILIFYLLVTVISVGLFAPPLAKLIDKYLIDPFKKKKA